MKTRKSGLHFDAKMSTLCSNLRTGLVMRCKCKCERAFDRWFFFCIAFAFLHSIEFFFAFSHCIRKICLPACTDHMAIFLWSLEISCALRTKETSTWCQIAVVMLPVQSHAHLSNKKRVQLHNMNAKTRICNANAKKPICNWLMRCSAMVFSYLTNAKLDLRDQPCLKRWQLPENFKLETNSLKGEMSYQVSMIVRMYTAPHYFINSFFFHTAWNLEGIGYFLKP